MTSLVCEPLHAAHRHHARRPKVKWATAASTEVASTKAPTAQSRPRLTTAGVTAWMLEQRCSGTDTSTGGAVPSTGAALAPSCTKKHKQAEMELSRSVASPPVATQTCGTCNGTGLLNQSWPPTDNACEKTRVHTCSSSALSGALSQPSCGAAASASEGGDTSGCFRSPSWAACNAAAGASARGHALARH